MRFRFGKYTIDSRLRELRRDDELCGLEPQVFDVLLYLIEHRNRVVARQDLLTAVWRGRIVSDSALDARINAARNAIDDNGIEQRLIRTLRSKGYRFVGSIVEEATAGLTEIATDRHMGSGGFNYPTIAVLPLDSNGTDARYHALADGIAEDLIVALAKISWLSVATRATSFSVRGQTFNPLQAANRMRVRYLLSGSVRSQSGRIRITLQLIDAITDRQIWTSSYDQDGVSDFAHQDQICERIISAIEPQLFIAEHLRINSKELANFNDWECIVRALSLMNTRAESDIVAAHALLNKSVSINPQSTHNYSLLSIATTLRVHMGWADRRDVIPAALAMAYKALSLNPEEPWAHAALGYAGIWKDHPEEAIPSLKEAIALNPTFAAAHYFLALAATYAGHNCDYAFAHAHEAERWAKRDILMRGYAGAADNIRATACFSAERYMHGVDYARRAATYGPGSPTVHRALLINLALQGQPEKAKETLRTLTLLAPKISQTWLKQNAMWSSGSVNKRYMEAFRIAGILPR